jgi:hypothetical protein
MGAEPYWYIVPYEADIEAALQKLRQGEFQAGRYYPVTPFPEFPVDLEAPPTAPLHRSIEEVMAGVDENGTRSILDIEHAASAPLGDGQMPFCTAFPLADSDLVGLFGTARPTRGMIETADAMWDRIDRGSAIYVILFDSDKPSEILFAGYSFD